MPIKKDGAKDPKKSPASPVPLEASVPARTAEQTPGPFEPADTPTSVVSHQSGAVPAEAVGPATDVLKGKFKAQSIPLQVDFYDLIDVADSGRKAAGLSPEQPGSTGDGLQLDDVKRLAVLATPGKAIDVAANGVGVRANSAKAIEATGSGVGVVANTNKGIEASDTGVGVRIGSNLKFNATGQLEVVNNAFFGQHFLLPSATDFNNVVPPTYPPGIYGIPNGGGFLNRPGSDGNLAGNGFLQMFSHSPDRAVDVTQIYFNAVGQMWLRAKHDSAGYFTPWAPLPKANASKAMESTDSGVGVVANPNKAIEATSSGVGVKANASKAIEATSNGVGVVANTASGIKVDNAGVGINFGSSLQVSSNRLEVSSSISNRTVLQATVNASATNIVRRNLIWTQGNNFAYVKVAILANNVQQFVLTLTAYHVWNSLTGGAVLDISNVYKPPGCPIRNVILTKMASTGHGFAVDLEFSSNATVMINYSFADLNGAEILSLGPLHPLSNKTKSHALDVPGQVFIHE